MVEYEKYINKLIVFLLIKVSIQKWKCRSYFIYNKNKNYKDIQNKFKNRIRVRVK